MKTALTDFAKNWTFWPDTANIPHLKDNEKNEKQYTLLLGLFFAFAAVTGALFLEHELWQDELYTLDHFVLVPLSTTLNDYHSTNNHILFNFIANIYLRLIGITNLRDLLENPLIIRVLPYSFTLLSIPSFYYGVKRIQGPLFALITVSLFISSIQLYTFGAQVRGYSLDLLLCILLLNFLLSFHHSPRNRLLPLITFTGTLLLINLPTTIYFIGALIVLTGLSNFSWIRSSKGKLFMASANFKLAAALLGAILLTAIFFFFKMDQLTRNPLLKGSGNSIKQLILQPISVFYRLLDWRIILVIPVLLVTLHLIKGIEVKASIFLIGSLLLPFLFFAFHNPVIVLRTWIILLPTFCLLLAQYFYQFLCLKKGLLVPWVILLIAGTLSSLLLLKRQTLQQHASGFAALDLRYQYHLFGFNPKEVVKKANEYSTQQGKGVILLDHSLGGISYYLEGYNVAFQDKLSAPRGGKLFLISDGPRAFEQSAFASAIILDSGSQNNQRFYKWYLLETEPLPVK